MTGDDTARAATDRPFDNSNLRERTERELLARLVQAADQRRAQGDCPAGRALDDRQMTRLEDDLVAGLHVRAALTDHTSRAPTDPGRDP